MSYIDIIILIPLLWAGYRGFTKGVIIEIVGILAFVLGIWGAIYFSDFIADFVTDNINKKYEPVISFTILFIGIVILVFVLGKMLEKVINLAQLKLANKIAGAVFGVSKILLILSFLVLIINKYDSSMHFIPEKVKEESLLYEPLIDLSKLVLPVIEDSDTFHEKEGFFEKIMGKPLFSKN
ncbi:MAG: CvpA family protein [Flavobacteriales bacterium]|nr:CvpA family protein [Flavobacteriales bacterium]